MPLEQLFFGCRDLNQFLKGKRQLEYEQTVEYPKQYIFCGARDLNKFLKGSRLLEFDQVEPKQQSGIRQKMQFCTYCFSPFILTLATIDRLINTFLYQSQIPFILWIITTIPFITAMFFIWFNSRHYKIVILIFLIEWILDFAAFLTLLITFLEIEYEDCHYHSDSQQKICKFKSWEIDLAWFLYFILPTLVIYICLIILMWQVYKSRPNPESQYIIQQETNRSNIP